MRSTIGCVSNLDTNYETTASTTPNSARTRAGSMWHEPTSRPYIRIGASHAAATHTILSPPPSPSSEFRDLAPIRRRRGDSWLSESVRPPRERRQELAVEPEAAVPVERPAAEPQVTVRVERPGYSTHEVPMPATHLSSQHFAPLMATCQDLEE